MVGAFVKCMVTVWLIPSGQSSRQPNSVPAICKVLLTEFEKDHLVKTGAPDVLYIDCKENLKWLETTERLEFYMEKGQCQ